LQILLALLLVAFAILFNVSAANAKRTDDVVILKNGDRLTGEVKGLSRGELRFKADYMAEAVRLDWVRVERLESKDRFLVYLTDGKLLTDFVRLVSANTETENFIIGPGNSAVRVRQFDVLRIVPVEEKFWAQLEGNVDFGFNFTSGNDQYSTELNASATYRREKDSVTASVDSVFSGQSEGSSTARKEFGLNYERQLSPRWYVGGLLDLLSSDQQSLQLRTTVGGLVGRNVVQSERTRMSVFGGAAGTRENYSAIVGQDRTTNADALAGVRFTTFRFKTTDLTSRLIVFPSLTTPGRLRLQLNTDWRLKLAKDLYWGLHLYENLDTKPPVRADKNDFGISTSLGWKF
jgi:putative salt-induced outer membrane protein YdiY